MRNKIIMEQFERLMKQIEAEYLNAQAEGDNKAVMTHKHRLQSMRNILKIIRSLEFEVKRADDLKGIPGIGKGTLQRVEEILETKGLKEIGNVYSEDKQKIIDSIQELQTVIGIGKATARNLVVKHHIRSVSELKEAVLRGRVHVTHAIELGLKYHGIVKGRIPRREITSINKYLIKQALAIDPKLETLICGSYRRGKSTSGDIDLLLYHPEIQNNEQVIQAAKYGVPQYLQLYVQKLIDCGFLLDSLTDQQPFILYMGFCRCKLGLPVRRIDIRYIPFTSLPTSMLHWTGPFELNIYLRHEAKKRGMILNEHGLFMRNTDQEIRIDITSEADVFEVFGMEYMTPEQRNAFDTGKVKLESLKIR